MNTLSCSRRARRPQNVVQRSFLKQYPKGYVFCVNLQAREPPCLS